MALQLIPGRSLAFLILNLLDLLTAFSALVLPAILGGIVLVHLSFFAGCKVSGPAALHRVMNIFAEI